MADTGQDTFDEIMSDAAPEAAAAATPVEQAGEQAAVEPADKGEAGGPTRDERGRFAAAQQEQQSTRAATEQPAAEATRQDNRIPLAEHLSERERRQAAEKRAEEAERRWQEHERKMAAEKARQEPQQPADPDIDPYTDLPGYLAQHDRRAQTAMQQFAEQFMLQQNVRFARYRHGALYDQAHKALTEAAQSDPYLGQRIFASADPAEATVAWFKEQQALKEFGTDPAAYRERVLTEALKDPAFRQKAMASWRDEAQQPGARPNSTQLPPSLSRATAAAANAAETVRAQSGREMLDEFLPVR